MGALGQGADRLVVLGVVVISDDLTGRGGRCAGGERGGGGGEDEEQTAEPTRDHRTSLELWRVVARQRARRVYPKTERRAQPALAADELVAAGLAAPDEEGDKNAELPNARGEALVLWDGLPREAPRVPGIGIDQVDGDLIDRLCRVGGSGLGELRGFAAGPRHAKAPCPAPLIGASDPRPIFQWIEGVTSLARRSLPGAVALDCERPVRASSRKPQLWSRRRAGGRGRPGAPL